jgi:hypothetical protein
VAVPNDQETRHDNHETSGRFWLRRRVALEQCWAEQQDYAIEKPRTERASGAIVNYVRIAPNSVGGSKLLVIDIAG